MAQIFFALTLATLTLPIALDARAENLTLTGIVSHVRDGDTIEVGPIAIRLQGIAAPEANEPGGAVAAEAMRDLILGKDLRCDLTGDRSKGEVRPTSSRHPPGQLLPHLGRTGRVPAVEVTLRFRLRRFDPIIGHGPRFAEVVSGTTSAWRGRMTSSVTHPWHHRAPISANARAIFSSCPGTNSTKKRSLSSRARPVKLSRCLSSKSFAKHSRRRRAHLLRSS